MNCLCFIFITCILRGKKWVFLFPQDHFYLWKHSFSLIKTTKFNASTTDFLPNFWDELKEMKAEIVQFFIWCVVLCSVQNDIFVRTDSVQFCPCAIWWCLRQQIWWRLEQCFPIIDCISFHRQCNDVAGTSQKNHNEGFQDRVSYHRGRSISKSISNHSKWSNYNS